MPVILPFDGHHPEISSEAWVAPNASVIGKVRIDADASVWFGAVLRGDIDEIVLGARSNLQDNAVIHTESGSPTIIGSDVSIGHGAIVHGCVVEDGCLIGMNATVLNGAVIGAQSLVAAGAVVLEGTIVPPRSLVAGVPGKVRRQLSDEEVAALHGNAARYVPRSKVYRAAE
ncbi:MAG: gamma carbonic anhydrase family protein [Pseudolysinimonas sp.]|uniref:gamma carbonic anhydrase family protein n=1 Tax=Pseudolysinimonas sp. TaxID=2680009 RepID=UPI0032652836